jgi:hypothetical protein
MYRFIVLYLGSVVRLLRARRSLLLENLALRQQLAVLNEFGLYLGGPGFRPVLPAAIKRKCAGAVRADCDSGDRCTRRCGGVSGVHHSGRPLQIHADHFSLLVDADHSGDRAWCGEQARDGERRDRFRTGWRGFGDPFRGRSTNVGGGTRQALSLASHEVNLELYPPGLVGPLRGVGVHRKDGPRQIGEDYNQVGRPSGAVQRYFRLAILSRSPEHRDHYGLSMALVAGRRPLSPIWYRRSTGAGGNPSPWA